MPKQHHPKTLRFSELEVGDHFFWGGKEHVKLPEVESGPVHGVGCEERRYNGIVNCIQVGTLTLSGMGNDVEVYRCAENDCYYEDLRERLRQIQELSAL
jgi:hypothetical protein